MFLVNVDVKHILGMLGFNRVLLAATVRSKNDLLQFPTMQVRWALQFWTSSFSTMGASSCLEAPDLVRRWERTQLDYQ